MAVPRLLLILMTSVGCFTACSPTFDWRDARPDEQIVVLFPCKPDHHVRRSVVEGLSIEMRLSSCATADHTFGLSMVDAPDLSQMPTLMQAMRSALVDNLGGAAATVRPLPEATVVGATPDPAARGLAVTGRRTDGSTVQAQARFFRKGLRVYQATVVGQSLDEAALETFFSSLRLAP